MEHSTDFGFAPGHAASSAAVALASIDSLADELKAAANNLRRAQPRLKPGVYKLGELPDLSPAWKAEAARIRTFGKRLHAQGGAALMIEVYDRAIERHGCHGVQGVTAQWDGIGSWQS